jgi:Ca-activated chloride channel family protein
MIYKIKKYICSLFLIVVSLQFHGQSIESKMKLSQGNQDYKNGDFKKSSSSYEKSLSEDEKNIDAFYNSGNSSYMNGDFESARESFNSFISKTNNIDDKSKAHYNIGTSFLTEYAKEAKEKGKAPSSDILKNAVKEYQQALRYSPNDKDARYNLSYAMKLLQNQQKQDQENKDKDKDKDDKDQENNKDKDQQGEKDKEKDKKKDPKPNETKEQAIKNLDAINNDEQKVLLKVNKKKGDQKKKSKIKDW